MWIGICGNGTHIQVQVGLFFWICVAFLARSIFLALIKAWAATPTSSAYLGFTNCFIPSKGFPAEETTEYASAAPMRVKALILVKEKQDLGRG